MTEIEIGKGKGSKLTKLEKRKGKGKRKVLNGSMTSTVKLIALFNIVIVFLIFMFIFLNSLKFFQGYSVWDFFSGKEWRVNVGDDSKSTFGLLPLLKGSFLVTSISLIIAIPLSLGTAIYISEYASGKSREFLKVIVETMAAIPSVVLGFIGLMVLSIPLQKLFDLSTGKTALTGGIILAFMAMPTIISISDDAIRALDKSYKEASLALGATKLQTIVKVLLPAAFPGILAGIMLGIGRIIGETMTVLMVTGNSPVFDVKILGPVRTMTATIAAEMGEAVNGSLHQFGLFAIGLILFSISFMTTTLASHFTERERKKMKG